MEDKIKVVPKYLDGGEGYSRLVKVTYKPNRIHVQLEHSPLYSPSGFGIVSTLETEKEIVLMKRTKEVACYKNQFSCVSGGTPHGLKNFDEWAAERVKQETAHYPRVDLLGIGSDEMESCEFLAYRGFVKKIGELPKPTINPQGVMKYSDIFVLDKSQLRTFMEKNRYEIASILSPLLSLALNEHEGTLTFLKRE